MRVSGWKLAADGKSMTHLDGGRLASTGFGVWACDCGKRSEPADLDNLDAWVAWRDQHTACAPRSKR